jgi:ATP phosphoribosyltransferase
MLRLALPKGRLLRGTAELFHKAGLELIDYDEQSRSYRPHCPGFPNLWVKVFQEKDIPVQVAVGNYDLGICGLDWVEELLSKYPSSALVKVRDLGYGKHHLCVATSPRTEIVSLEQLKEKERLICLASEYPNLSERLALNLRLRRFKIFPLWGAAEAYPPENADLILVSSSAVSFPPQGDLISVATILSSSAFIIANRESWETKDMSPLLEPLCRAIGTCGEGAWSPEDDRRKETQSSMIPASQPFAPLIRLALPDGHQQPPTLEFLERAGIKTRGYAEGSRRPVIEFDGVEAKVIRPQDMPLQVANGNFDLAVTGRDWLYDHLCRFPSSPVRELLDLGFGKVKIVAVVSQKLPADSVDALRQLLIEGKLSPLRVASEYVNIVDKYARDNHLSPYRVIPTWGASEVFLPEDADLLIENTQTGHTLAKHQLKIIDTLLESSACLIATAHSSFEGIKGERIASFLQALRRAGAKDKGG